MKDIRTQRQSVRSAGWCLAFMGVMVLGFLGTVRSAQAVPACGPGNHWVDQCPPGVDRFPLSWAYLDLWIPDNTGQQIQLVLAGPATVTRGAPVDAIVNHPVLGDVGMTDGHLGVIPLTLAERFTGSGITLTGTGVGAIVEATEAGIPRPDLAYSFFDVFAEIEGPFGKARNQAPVHVDGDRWLVGVPPNALAVLPVFPPPPLPVAVDPACSALDPLAAIIYCGFQDTPFYLVDDDGEFILDGGNLILVATLHSEAHVVHIPEPATWLLLATSCAGLVGLSWRRRRRTT